MIIIIYMSKMKTLEIDNIKKNLRREGLVVFDVDKNDISLQELASCFGMVVLGDKGDIIQPLHAQDKGNGSYGSFTYNVGYDAFPWHTDTAYWEIPVRYLMLTSDKPSPCATIARSFESLIECIADFDYLAERAVYMLNIPGRRKLLSPVIRRRELTGYRFDFNIYKPMNKEAVILSDMILMELSKKHERVVWNGNNVAIIDNWRFIHAREDAHQDKNRILKRLYIDELV